MITTAEDKITYDDQVFPLFQQSCLNCHNPDKNKGGLDLSTYSGAMKGGSGGKIAEPGDLSSKIIGVCLQTITPKMPPEGEKLGGAQIAIIKGWIEGGLLENKNSSARKPSKPKFETALKSDPAAKPEGLPPMPEHLRLEPVVTSAKASAVHAMVASPWAPLVALTGQHQVLLHDANTLELLAVLPFPEGTPLSLAFTPDGRYLIVGGGIPGKSGVTVTYNIKTGERTLTAGKEFDSILAADIRPGFDIVVTGGPSRLLKLWNSQTGEVIASIKKHTDWITALDISPDGVLVASGDRNGGVWVWEAGTGNEFQTLRGHQGGITSAVFRADSNILATSSEDGTVRFWEMNGGSEVRKNDAHPGGVTAMAFGRDGSSITAGRDRKVRLWKSDFNPGRELVKDLPALPTAVALSSDGGRAFVADYRGTIRVYETGEGKPLGEFTAAPPSIDSRLAAMDADVQATTAAIATAESTLAEATGQLDGAKKAMADAEQAAAQAHAIHDAAKKGEGELRQKIDQLRQNLSGRHGEIDKLANEESELGKELEAKRQAVSALPEEHRNPPDIAVLETRHHQATEQLAKLREELSGWESEEKTSVGALEGLTRAVAAAFERLKPAEDAIGGKREAIASAEKAFNEAKAHRDARQRELELLQTTEKHWQAATVNTRAIEAREAIRPLAQKAEDLQTDYREAAIAFESETGGLISKRAERAAFAAKLNDPALASQHAEIRATLAALDADIARRSAAVSAGEGKLAELYPEVEKATRRVFEASVTADDLKAAYFTALRK